ncbi:hypothetical protein CAPTEDRAFT_206458 [Capitella teleta]|uniref:CFAP47-like immunoglobulin-like domain-containing protein n=1 Tax=Capitella teleta TaxID=283909 RepID=R7T4V2_CAPTE|nr:hypothetical protein CAPTEDRAFT_206458 [Capitella teleta]|eukprot:ELT88008.1 hypothetical protein CAPTEDRAFT_206458 [Capitella teleta]
MQFKFNLIHFSDSSLLGYELLLKLIRQHRDKHTGLVVLVFNVVFAPFKTISNDAQLRVQGATGGMWRFPLKFVATEPEPDDLVIIEASALNQESAIGFRLTSQTSVNRTSIVVIISYFYRFALRKMNGQTCV